MIPYLGVYVGCAHKPQPRQGHHSQLSPMPGFWSMHEPQGTWFHWVKKCFPHLYGRDLLPPRVSHSKGTELIEASAIYIFCIHFQLNRRNVICIFWSSAEEQ